MGGPRTSSEAALSGPRRRASAEKRRPHALRRIPSGDSRDNPPEKGSTLRRTSQSRTSSEAIGDQPRNPWGSFCADPTRGGSSYPSFPAQTGVPVLYGALGSRNSGRQPFGPQLRRHRVVPSAGSWEKGSRPHCGFAPREGE